MTREGEFLRSNLLGDGQGEVVPIGIAFLLVRRDGIMDLRLYAVVEEVLLQFIATRTEYRKNVPDGGRRSLRQANQGISHLREIGVGNGAAILVVGIETEQFGVENGSLEFIDTGITALIVMDILLMRAVITESTDDGSQLVVAGGNGTGVAKSTEVFAGIERMAGSISEGAGT